MATLKKYNLQGKQLGTVDVDQALSEATANSQMIKDYIVAVRRNARQWSASTKTRSEVKHTTKKPHKQKGTGRARQGSLVSPQFRGGGIVFGPKPKFDQFVRINKKERRQAIAAIIASKISEQKIIVLDSTALDAPKTKTVAEFMNAANISGRTLFLGESNEAVIDVEGIKPFTVSLQSETHYNFRKSLRNIPRVEFSLAKNISGYDVLIAQNIVVTEEALQELQQWLCAAS